MNKNIEKKFFERFKFFHPEKSAQESLIIFGFECGDGWKDLIWKLCEDIDKIVKKEKIDDFEVIQVKEKFGTLRFYTHNANEEILELINNAEIESGNICENCGQPGTTSNFSDGWVTTLCEKCRRVKK